MCATLAFDGVCPAASSGVSFGCLLFHVWSPCKETIKWSGVGKKTLWWISTIVFFRVPYGHIIILKCKDGLHIHNRLWWAPVLLTDSINHFKRFLLQFSRLLHHRRERWKVRGVLAIRYISCSYQKIAITLSAAIKLSAVCVCMDAAVWQTAVEHHDLFRHPCPIDLPWGVSEFISLEGHPPMSSTSPSGPTWAHQKG